MASTVTVRNSLTNDRFQVKVRPNQSVRDAIKESGIVHGDEFGVRDKNGTIVDDTPISEHEGQVLNVGLPGDMVRGG